MYEEITAQARQAVTELVDAAGLRAGELLVIGCSSSEMVGARIGKGSSMEAAQAALDGIWPVVQERGIYLAAQCCEHLNRALILDEAAGENLAMRSSTSARGRTREARSRLRCGSGWSAPQRSSTSAPRPG